MLVREIGNDLKECNATVVQKTTSESVWFNLERLYEFVNSDCIDKTENVLGLLEVSENMSGCIMTIQRLRSLFEFYMWYGSIFLSYYPKNSETSDEP